MDLIKLVEAKERERLKEFRLGRAQADMKPDADEAAREKQREEALEKMNFPAFKAGDTINIHLKITEGGKTRIQQFKGTVIQRRNPNTTGETITVRKVSNGVGVERILPILSPNIDKIELVREGVVRRARLYYLRGKTGKAARLKEKKAPAKA